MRFKSSDLIFKEKLADVEAKKDSVYGKRNCWVSRLKLQDISTAFRYLKQLTCKSNAKV